MYIAEKKLRVILSTFCFKRKESSPIRIIQRSFQCKVSCFLRPSLFIACKSRHNLCMNRVLLDRKHCVNSVQIRSFFWSIFSCIQSKCGKIRTRKNSVFGHFSRSGIVRSCTVKQGNPTIFVKQKFSLKTV